MPPSLRTPRPGLAWLAAACALAWGGLVAADPLPVARVDRAGPVLFETDVRPLLERSCLACHNAGERQGDLVLETVEAMLAGGDSGAAIVPGSAEKSLLFTLAAHRAEPAMPPPSNGVAAPDLTPEELGLLGLWIDRGAKSGGAQAAAPRGWRPIDPSYRPVSALAVTPDAQVVAVARANRLLLHHAPSGRLVEELVDPSLAPSAAAHRDLVGAVAFNRDGDLLASGGYREAKIWRRPRDVRAFEVAAGATTALAASPDGRRFATASPGAIRLWDAAAGAAGPVIDAPGGPATALSWTPDGLAVVAGFPDGSLRCHRASDGVFLGSADAGAAVRAMTLALLPAGGGPAGAAEAGPVLVVGGTDASLRLFRVPNAPPAKVVGEPDPRRRFAASRDRRLLALAGDETVTMVALDGDAAPTTLGAWRLDLGPATSLCFVEGPESTTLATGSADGTVSLWSVPDGRLLRRGSAASAPVTALVAAGDGGRIVSGDGQGGVAVWRGPGAVPAPSTPAPGPLDTVTASAFHSGRRLLATAGSLGGAAVIAVRSLDGTAAPVILRGHTAPVRAMTFTADGARLVSGGDDRSVRVWDWAGPAAEVAAVADAGAAVTALAASADAGRVLAAGADHVLREFTPADGMLTREYRGHGGPILAAGVDPSGRPWSVSADATVRHWNPADGAQAASWSMPSAPVAAAAGADGQTLVVAASDGVVRSHRLGGGELVKAFVGPAGATRALVLSGDGARCVTLDVKGERTILRAWDVAAGTLVESLEAGAIVAAAPADDGTIACVGARGEVERVRPSLERRLEGFAQPVAGLAFAGGGTIVAAAADGALRGYQAATGQPTFATGHGGPITVLAASADGAVLGSGGKGGTVRFWKGDGSPLGPGITGLAGDVSALALSTDGRRAVVGSAAPPGQGGGWVVHEPATAAMLERFPARAGGARDAVVAADGLSVLSAADDGVWRWPLSALAVVPGQGGPVTAIAALPGVVAEVVTGGADGVVRRVRLVDGQVAAQYPHGGPVAAVAVRPDGTRFASVGESGSLRLWRPDGQAVAEVRGDQRRAAAVARLTRQQTAATDRVAVAKRLAEGAEKEVPAKAEVAAKAKATLDAAEADLKAKQDAFTAADAARIAAEAATLAASAESRAAAVARQAVERQMQGVQGEVQLAERKSALLAAAAGAAPADAAKKQAADGAVQMLAAARQKLEQTQAAVQAATTTATAAKTAADGMAQKVAGAQKPASDAAAAVRAALSVRRLATQEHEIAAREAASAAAALPVAREALARAEGTLSETKQGLERATAAAAEAVAPIRHVAFSPDGSLVATAGDFPAAALWDAETGGAVATFHGHATKLAGAAFLADGRLATAAGDATAIVWEVNPSWTLERTIGAGGAAEAIADRVLALDWSADSSLLLVGGGVPSRSGELALFRAADGQRVLHLPEAHDDAVLSARFSPDGKRIASGGADKYLRTFDSSDGAPVRRFEGHTNYVLAVAWKGDGQTLASAGADNTVKLWDPETGDQRATVPPLTRHVTALRFVGDGDTFVSGGGDRIPRLHSASSGGVIRTFPEMPAWIHAVDVTPGGEWFVVGDAAGNVKAWNATNGQALPDVEPAP